MAVSKSLRFQVLRRDNHTCRYCGATAPDAVITVDHVIPVAHGGTDTAENLVAACRDCNAGKAATDPGAPLVADVARDALRWKAAREVAVQFMEADREAKEAILRELFYEWETQWRTVYDLGQFPPLPIEWEASVEKWYARGLTLPIMRHFVGVAVRKRASSWMKDKDVWRYYAGCCWSALTEIETAVQQLLAEETSPDAP